MGIDVNYIGTKELETQINVRVDASDPPNIAKLAEINTFWPAE